MAYRRICSECNKCSFSASDYGNWTCPYCGSEVNKEIDENE